MNFIKLLHPVTYRFDIEGFAALTMRSRITAQDIAQTAIRLEQKLHTGFIAQDVEASAQSLQFDFSGVDAPGTPDGLYALRYAEFVVPLTRALQQLSAGNDELIPGLYRCETNALCC